MQGQWQRGLIVRNLRVDTILDATLDLAHGGSLDARAGQLP